MKASVQPCAMRPNTARCDSARIVSQIQPGITVVMHVTPHSCRPIRVERRGGTPFGAATAWQGKGREGNHAASCSAELCNGCRRARNTSRRSRKDCRTARMHLPAFKERLPTLKEGLPHSTHAPAGVQGTLADARGRTAAQYTCTCRRSRNVCRCSRKDCRTIHMHLPAFKERLPMPTEQSHATPGRQAPHQETLSISVWRLRQSTTTRHHRRTP